MKKEIRALIGGILLILLLLLAIVISCSAHERVTYLLGGREKQSQQIQGDIVIDGLNFTHWLASENRCPIVSGKLRLCDIISAIDETSDVIKQKHKGRIMFVLKDRETALNNPATRAIYAETARRNKVYIYVVERYKIPLKTEYNHSTRGTEHARLGRDDFYMGILAKKFKCKVLTADRFRDFDQLRKHLNPFHVYEYTWWRSYPERDYINPHASEFQRLRKPRRVHYKNYDFWGTDECNIESFV